MWGEGREGTPHLVDDAGSVVCRCSRVWRTMCSLTDICTSAGMSGDVWLIFTAASRKPRVLGSFSLSAMAPLELGALAEEGLEVSLFLQGVQRSFQKRKRKTATRATPHTVTTTARRPTEVPALGVRQAGRDRRTEAGEAGRAVEEGAHTGTKTEEEKRMAVRKLPRRRGHGCRVDAPQSTGLHPRLISQLPLPPLPAWGAPYCLLACARGRESNFNNSLSKCADS